MLKITIDGVINVETKTYADVVRLVEAGKPVAVIEKFAAMYLETLDPHQKLKEQWYNSHRVIEDMAEIVRQEDAIIDNEDGTKSIVVVKQGRELTLSEQQVFDAATSNRAALEDGFTRPAVLDESGEIVSPETVLVEATPWLKTLRGGDGGEVPVFTPQAATEWVAATFPQIRKQARDEAVAKITVTTTSGKVFDGDERSQGRMARAVTVGEAGATTLWKLADNSVSEVSWEELREALFLAGQAQTEIWIEE